MNKSTVLVLSFIVLFAAGIADARSASYQDDQTLNEQNLKGSPGMTSTGTFINPDNNIYPGGRTQNGITPNPIDSPSQFLATAHAVAVRRLEDNNKLTSDARVYFRGQVVNIDKNTSRIVVRGDNGTTGFYTVNDRSDLDNLNKGDRVEIIHE